MGALGGVECLETAAAMASSSVVSGAGAARLSPVSAGAGARGRAGTGRVTGVFCGVAIDAAAALGCAFVGAGSAIETSSAGSSWSEDIGAAGSGCSGASLVSEASSCDILALAVTIPTITIRRAIPE